MKRQVEEVSCDVCARQGGGPAWFTCPLPFGSFDVCDACCQQPAYKVNAALAKRAAAHETKKWQSGIRDAALAQVRGAAFDQQRAAPAFCTGCLQGCAWCRR